MKKKKKYAILNDNRVTLTNKSSCSVWGRCNMPGTGLIYDSSFPRYIRKHKTGEDKKPSEIEDKMDSAMRRSA